MRALQVLVVLFALAAPIFAARSEAPPPYVVIAHPSNPSGAIGRRFLADAFLKKASRWPHGEAIRPVDQRGDSSPRRAFSEEVLKRSVAAVKNYWQQIIFSGRDVPPPELPTDEEVLRYVLEYPGAVGYVSGGARTRGARVLSVE